MEVSDQEIYEAVIDSITARKDIDGDDMDLDNSDTPIEPCPSQRDALKAVLTLSRYFDEQNNPTAHKFEAIVGSLNRQLHHDSTRSMRATVLTEFFQKL